jgi:hypothetical protein
MSEPTSLGPPIRPITPLQTAAPGVGSTSIADGQMLCERCGAEMSRMHAVWRCSACGFKTDCCGW